MDSPRTARRVSGSVALAEYGQTLSADLLHSDDFLLFVALHVDALLSFTLTLREF